ncbi:DUF4373 domain-containing protein [Gudongella sp. SC589]|uniref:DUF4373 domain-containing protein n=1 Tax=Gudongella sp. SC589 TaxID=3385990 RepID=UPI003904B82C
MARPQKSGLDYFSLDVVMSDEVEIIEAEYGLEGFAILIKLYQKIYSEGYYYQWGDKEQILFSNRVSVDRNLLITIVDNCVKWGLFDEKLYKTYNILTSRRIQNQYFTATYKRTGLEVIQEYLLIDISDRDNVTTTSVSDDRNSPTTDVSVDKSTQSKEEKSKEEKSNTVEVQKVIKLYRDKLKHLPQPRKITDERKKHINARINEYGIDEVVSGIDKASRMKFLAGDNKRGWKADIDWIFQPTNFAKILEEKYASEPPQKKPLPDDDNYFLNRG